MTACIFLEAPGWKNRLPQGGRRSRDEFSGDSAGATGSEMGRAVAHAGCPGVPAGEAVRGEAGVSEGEKKGIKLVA